MSWLAVFLALPAAVGYALSALFLKQALHRGVSGRCVNLTVNLLTAAVFQLILLIECSPIPWPEVWKPLLVGVVFFVGQILLFLALSRGDVGVAAPLMGAKTVFVVFLVGLLALQPPSARAWLAAAVGALGVFLIGGGSVRFFFHPNARLVILAALASAFCFALTDSLLQIWSRSFGFGAFVSLMFGTAGMLSALGWLLFKNEPAPPRAAWLPLGIGALIMVIQSFAFCLAIVLSGDAPSANILYSLRAVFSVLAVIWLGKSLGLPESARGKFSFQLAGAICIFAAVLLILIS